MTTAAAQGSPGASAPTECGWYVLRIPPEPALVRLVRASLRAALEQVRLHELVDTALLLLSEVVTNGINHSAGPVTVRISWDERAVLAVRVHDEGPALPRNRRPAETDEGGRGLVLLDACATRWGVERGPRGGKSVWFELRA